MPASLIRFVVSRLRLAAFLWRQAAGFGQGWVALTVIPAAAFVPAAFFTPGALLARGHRFGCRQAGATALFRSLAAAVAVHRQDHHRNDEGETKRYGDN
ncbi:MAG: hypothetical protein QGF56_00640 [Verrucomicrobiota bacterium]|nr:hypothetical protein [Verrucomicrobiota bacterium]